MLFAAAVLGGGFYFSGTAGQSNRDAAQSLLRAGLRYLFGDAPEPARKSAKRGGRAWGKVRKAFLEKHQEADERTKVQQGAIRAAGAEDTAEGTAGAPDSAGTANPGPIPLSSNFSSRSLAARAAPLAGRVRAEAPRGDGGRGGATDATAGSKDIALPQSGAR